MAVIVWSHEAEIMVTLTDLPDGTTQEDLDVQYQQFSDWELEMLADIPLEGQICTEEELAEFHTDLAHVKTMTVQEYIDHVREYYELG